MIHICPNQKKKKKVLELEINKWKRGEKAKSKNKKLDYVY